MCKSQAYLLTAKKKKKIMDNVVFVKPENGKVYLEDLLGEQKIVEGTIKEMKLIAHKIIIESN